MNKKELVKEVSSRIAGVTQKDISAIIDLLPEIIREAVINDDRVVLSEFITFKKIHVHEKRGQSNLYQKKWEKEAHDEICVKLSDSYKIIE